MKFRKVGVIGAGQMGNGIAHVCALAGYEVALHDVSRERIEAGLATIDGNMSRQVASDRITAEQRDAALARISIATSMESFEDADLVIESATENEDVKRKIFAELCPHLRRSEERRGGKDGPMRRSRHPEQRSMQSAHWA